MKQTILEKDEYAKETGVRICQAREMAGFRTQAALNEILMSEDYGWSSGRLANYESGRSVPHPMDARILGNVTGVSECWIMFGGGPIRPKDRDLQAIRYQNIRNATDGLRINQSDLDEFLMDARFTPAKFDDLIENPYKKITDRVARQIEKALHKKTRWLDEQHIDHDPICSRFPEDLQEVMRIYSEIDEAQRKMLIKMARVFMDDDKA